MLQKFSYFVQIVHNSSFYWPCFVKPRSILPLTAWNHWKPAQYIEERRDNKHCSINFLRVPPKLEESLTSLAECGECNLSCLVYRSWKGTCNNNNFVIPSHLRWSFIALSFIPLTLNRRCPFWRRWLDCDLETESYEFCIYIGAKANLNPAISLTQGC